MRGFFCLVVGGAGRGGAGCGGLGMSGCWGCVCGLTLEEGVRLGWDGMGCCGEGFGSVFVWSWFFVWLFCEGWGAGERERKGQMGFGFVRW